MSGATNLVHVEHFRRSVEQRLGLTFDDGRLAFLAEVLDARLRVRGLSANLYLSSLDHARGRDRELGELSRKLTVGETYFFRQEAHFHALEEHVLPERLAASAASRTLRMLSAGCASGEEAYSLAILLRELAVAPAYDVAVTGIDVNPDAIARARAGLYSAWSLRATTDARRKRWFIPEGSEFRVAPSIRDSVCFEPHNLLAPEMHPLAPGSQDVIFCRNVLMYFSPERAAQVIEKLTRALAPGGFLFLGHAETLRGSTQSLELEHTPDAFYYRRPVNSSEPRTERTAGAGGTVHGTWVREWLDTVERSSQRIKELSGDRVATSIRSSAPGAPRETAVARLERAAQLTQGDALEEAERACHELILEDARNAGAHYLLALCCERRAELTAAAAHDLRAVELDGDFAMPHLHLGMMARRRRDVGTARFELVEALRLLPREDNTRLRLFGGGFSREALLALCRLELTNLPEGAP